MSDRIGIPRIPVAAPVSVSAGDMMRPKRLDLRFEGFGAAAFQVLEGLRRRPHIEEYRKEKERIRSLVQEPFKRYRDDLVVNWLLPNRLGLETEKNVFSRLLKNDFGAGGCHYHYWMSFYRPGLSRLRDVQLAHSLWPEAFYVVAYAGNPVPELFKRLRGRIVSKPGDFLSIVNPILQKRATTLRITYGSQRTRRVIAEPLTDLPEDFQHVNELAVRVAIPREEVVELGAKLVGVGLESALALWPVYRYFLASSSSNP